MNSNSDLAPGAAAAPSTFTPREGVQGNFNRTLRIARHPGARYSSKPVPYTPGFADHLLLPKDHEPAEDVIGIELRIGERGNLLAIERTKSGGEARHHVRQFPYELAMTLPSGEVVFLEVTSLGRVDGGEGEGEGEELVGYRTPAEIAAAGMVMLRFGAEE